MIIMKTLMEMAGWMVWGPIGVIWIKLHLNGIIMGYEILLDGMVGGGGLDYTEGEYTGG